MKLPVLTLLFLTLLCTLASAQRYQEMIDAGTYTVEEIHQEAEAYFKVIGHGRGTGYKPYRRWEYVARREMNDAGVKISNFELTTQARAYRAQTAQQRGNSSFSGGSWHQLGPTAWHATSGWNPGLGRITDIGIENNNADHYIVGSPTGGVWKTLDGGNTWIPLTDQYSTVDVYALEISPFDNNVYLWGSTSGRIFKSTDGGASWSATGNVTGNGRVSRIQFHPTDPNIVYAVSESNGLFRSTNGGNTWTAVTGVSGVAGYDVEFKPNDPNTIYFSGVNVYRSTNGGNSFTQISGFGTAGNNYKRMAVSPASPTVVYVLESNGGKFGGFYKSTDSGATFTKLIDGATINYFGYSETGDDDSGQAPRNMAIAANPMNANEVHIGGVHTWKSINGGQSFFLTSFWTPDDASNLGVGYNHADIGIIKFFGNKMFVSSDGGIFTSTDGANTFQNRSVGLCIREFYKIGVSKTNPNVVSGGAQDNGTSIMRGANRQWVDWLGADGMESFVDWNNASIVYGTSQYGSMYRSTNQGTTETDLPKPPGVGDGAWVTPFEQDPQVSTTIYAAFADVWKSTDSGNNWTKISSFDNGNFDEMKLAPSNNQRIYVSRGSDLYTTSNGGSSWSTPSKAWGSSSINYIAVHPHDPQRVLIVTSSAVYQSTNAGSTWSNLSAGLPSGAKYCATWEDKGTNGIYVGGFGFVSYTNDNLAGQWSAFFDGLPNARVYELEINYVSNTIFAGTYGRGLWESGLHQDTPPAVAFSADKQFGCKGTDINFKDLSTGNPTSWEWTFDGGSPATSSLQNPTVTYHAAGTYLVRLKATNNIGQSTSETANYITIFDPSTPVATGAMRCDSGQVSLSAIAQPSEQLHWYGSATGSDSLYSGNVFNTNVGQSATFYVSSGIDYDLVQHLGASSNAIGSGDNHNGDYYLVFDAYKPFRLKSALVYAAGDADRTFQLRDASQNVLLEKTVFIQDGESRVDLDMDIPAGYDLQLGCVSPANLYRNNSGPEYPYSLAGVAQIKSSTAGPNYYYYLYDWEVESKERCESERVAVQAIVNTIPSPPVITASGSTILCPEDTLSIQLSPHCNNCSVLWSGGETDTLIRVYEAGIVTATLSNVCGESAASNEIQVMQLTPPELPVLNIAGDSLLCPNGSADLILTNLCANCTVLWSNGATEQHISVETPGTYTAVLTNICGNSQPSNPAIFNAGALPVQPEIAVLGPTLLCPGESSGLSVTNLCPDCNVLWSTGEGGESIGIYSEGMYTAVTTNACGQSPASVPVEIRSEQMPQTPVIAVSGPAALCPGATLELSVANLCPGCSVQWSNGVYDSTIVIATPGVYAAQMFNVCGASAETDSVEIDAATLPTVPAIINVGGSTSLCPGEIIHFEAYNNCPGCTVLWSTGESGPSIDVSSVGTYSAVNSNICGTSAVSNPVVLTPLSLPASPHISVTGNTTLCPGDSIQFTAVDVCPGCTVHWSTNDTSQSITVYEQGIYECRYENKCGIGAASAEYFISMFLPPAMPAIQASGPTDLCAGESIVLEVVNDVCFQCPVHWSNGATGLSTVVSAAGTYTAYTENIMNQCGDSPPSNAITVTNYPVFTPLIEVNNVCNLSAPDGSNYQWFIDSMPIPGATTQLWTAEISGHYSVSMTNSDGCTGTSSPLAVQACMSSTQSPDESFTARIYPNPARERVYLEVQPVRTTTLRLELYAADGKFVGQLFQGEVRPGKQVKEIALPALAAGVYRYRLTAGEERVEGNLVVERR